MSSGYIISRPGRTAGQPEGFDMDVEGLRYGELVADSLGFFLRRQRGGVTKNGQAKRASKNREAGKNNNYFRATAAPWIGIVARRRRAIRKCDARK